MMLFGGEDFYPNGGMRDFISSGDDPTELKCQALDKGCDWFHIWNLSTQSWVEAWTSWEDGMS